MAGREDGPELVGREDGPELVGFGLAGWGANLQSAPPPATGGRGSPRAATSPYAFVAGFFGSTMVDGPDEVAAPERVVADCGIDAEFVEAAAVCAAFAFAASSSACLRLIAAIIGGRGGSKATAAAGDDREERKLRPRCAEEFVEERIVPVASGGGR